MTRRIAIALSILIVGGIAAAAPASAIAPSVKVIPSHGLTEGQSVGVKGKNFAPNANLVAVECHSGPASANLCDQSTAVPAHASGSGKFSVAMNVRHLLTTTSGPVDCGAGPGPCVVNVGVANNFAATAVSVPISFATAGQPKQGSITVPMSVPANDTTLVNATGFAANARLDAALCTVDPGSASDCMPPVAFYTNAAGAGSVSFVAPPTISTVNTPSTDCTVFGSCEYGVWDPRDFFNTVARAFDVVAPQEPGTLTITPTTTGLHDGDTLTVSGTGWDANKPLRFFECDGLSAGSDCNNLAKLTAAPNGSFSKPYTVQAVSSSGQPVNCLTGPCWIIVLRLVREIPVFAARPITFAPVP